MVNQSPEAHSPDEVAGFIELTLRGDDVFTRWLAELDEVSGANQKIRAEHDTPTLNSVQRAADLSSRVDGWRSAATALLQANDGNFDVFTRGLEVVGWVTRLQHAAELGLGADEAADLARKVGSTHRLPIGSPSQKVLE